MDRTRRIAGSTAVATANEWTAVVVGYADGRQSRRRFIEMGLVPGARVTRVRSAPLGDPVEYAVYGARLAVRNHDAAELLIEVVDT